MRRIAALAVGAQAALGALWWIALWTQPALRAWFRPAAVSDEILLAFALPDLLLFVAAGVLAAIGIWRATRWAWPLLLLHTGAGLYAALYCLQLALLDTEAIAGAVLMAPSLIILPAALWIARP